MGILAPVRVTDNVFTGEAKTLRFTVTDSTGAVQNVTGWTINWKLEPSQGAAASVTKSASITDGPNGIVSVSLLAADTSGLTGGNYWHVLARTDSGSEAVLSEGTFALQSR